MSNINNNDISYSRCTFCCTNKPTTELKAIQQTNKNGMICKDCRKIYGFETEEDLIDDVSQNIKTPKEIVEYLDDIVIGQDMAKKILAVEIRNHFKRITNKDKLNGKVLRKNNILLTGPSGTGKTLLVENLAKLLNVPFAIANATSLTESGYVGNDVESILSTLLRNSNNNPLRAQYGIVFIDEIDKIARKGENMSITRDVSGEGVQQALLKMIEGAVIGVPENGGRIHPNQKLIEIDTTNILFICAGAFEGIEHIVSERLKDEKQSYSLGFGARIESKKDKPTEKELRKNIKLEDLQKFGMIPELLGRLPVICNLNPLEKDDLVSILSSKYGVLEEFKLRLELEDKTVEFTENCINRIAEICLEKQVGARGLRGIVNNLMIDILFEAPSSDINHYVIDDIDDIESDLSNIEIA